MARVSSTRCDRPAAALLMLLWALPTVALAHGAAPSAGARAAAPASGAAAPRFEAPPPGSYELPPIQQLGPHVLLGSEGEARPLLDLGAGQVALVAFVYTRCGEATGCPMALASLQRVDRLAAERPELEGRLRLVTVSFDPARDRPEVLASLRRALAPRTDWRFFTAADRAALAPVLEDFGQDAVPLVDASGAETGRIRHVLKVFLVDDRLRVRNVYSAGFLDPRLLVNDALTLVRVGPAAGLASE